MAEERLPQPSLRLVPSSRRLPTESPRSKQVQRIVTMLQLVVATRPDVAKYGLDFLEDFLMRFV